MISMGIEVERSRLMLSTPRLIALSVAFVLVPQIVALFVVPGIAEGDAYATARGAVQFELIPDIGGALIAMFVIVHLGWTDLVRHERFRTRGWVVLVPAAMLIASVAAIDYSNLADAGSTLVILLVAATFATGVSEELMFRGIALQAFRDRHREWVAAVFSSLLFGLLHLMNVVVAGPGAAFQAIWACGMGYLLYLCRRVGRGMALPIVVHWLWDFSTFSPELGREDVVLGDATFALFLVSVLLVIVVAIRHRAIPSSPLDPIRAPSAPRPPGE